MAPKTLFDKLWDGHTIQTSPDGLDLLHIDRSLLTDLTGTLALEELDAEGRAVIAPELLLATPDHLISTADGPGDVDPKHAHWVRTLERLAKTSNIRLWSRGSGQQGIVHIVGLESGFTLPGSTLVCGDSHTSTHGAVGALAWGIGSTEVKHVLATQSLWMKKPLRARIALDGTVQNGVSAKDIILWLIGQLGADYGREHAVEYAGAAITNMTIEERATICNLAIEMAARFGIIAPDEVTFDYLDGREFAPTGASWAQAVDYWKTLKTDEGAVFDKAASFDISSVTPQITWGTSPEHVTAIDGTVPRHPSADQKVYGYIGLEPGQSLQDVPIDYVFIGSCANGRIEDLRAAAKLVDGRKVASDVQAWVVPGSEAVRRQAEFEGLDAIFVEAGFAWRQPGCSMCVSVNGDIVAPGKRSVSTSNRNFVGRQGPDARTHLASPATAAASALTGKITDPRGFLR